MEIDLEQIKALARALRRYDLSKIEIKNGEQCITLERAVGGGAAGGVPAVFPMATGGREAGQVLCIIEAMKLMNEIEARSTGTIVEVLVENGKPVEFGEKLFKIRPRLMCSARSSSRTAARSRCASSARAASSASHRGGALEVRRRRAARALRRRGGVHRPRRREVATCTSPRSSRRRRSPAPTRSTRATASSRRTPPSPRCARSAAHVHRPDARGHAALGRQGHARAPRPKRFGMPLLPGTDVLRDAEHAVERRGASGSR
jgi:hypothetical protein